MAATREELLKAARDFAKLAETPFHRQIREHMEANAPPEVRDAVTDGMLFGSRRKRGGR